MGESPGRRGGLFTVHAYNSTRSCAKAVQSHSSWAAGVAIRPRDAALGCETLSKAPLNACADQGLDRFAAGYAPRFGHLRRLHHPIPSLFELHLYLWCSCCLDVKRLDVYPSCPAVAAQQTDTLSRT